EAAWKSASVTRDTTSVDELEARAAQDGPVVDAHAELVGAEAELVARQAVFDAATSGLDAEDIAALRAGRGHELGDRGAPEAIEAADGLGAAGREVAKLTIRCKEELAAAVERHEARLEADTHAALTDAREDREALNSAQKHYEEVLEAAVERLYKAEQAKAED